VVGIENPVHLLFIAAVALVVLGPRRLPDLAKALGHGIREFRDAISDGEDDAPATPPAAAAAAPAPAPPEGDATQPVPDPPAAAQASTAQETEQSTNGRT